MITLREVALKTCFSAAVLVIVTSAFLTVDWLDTRAILTGSLCGWVAFQCAYWIMRLLTEKSAR